MEHFIELLLTIQGINFKHPCIMFEIPWGDFYTAIYNFPHTKQSAEHTMCM